MSITELRAGRPSVSDGDVLLPALVIRDSALTHNLGVLQTLAANSGARLAPHLKTTMSPELVRRQLAAGAWGVTVAGIVQAHLAIDAGARRVLLANEIVGTSDIEWLARSTHNEALSVTVQVDSPAAVAILADGLDRCGIRGLQPVLLEVGPPGGRTGARDDRAVMATAASVRTTGCLSLAGVATYEGVVGHDRRTATLERVDAWLDYVKATTNRLAEAGLFDRLDRVMVTAGGTRYVDRVVERLAPGRWGGIEVDLVVRAGCYLTYGHGAGPDDSAFSGPDWPQLIPVVELWANVLSLPEPGLAIVGVGKKNVGERPDALIPLLHARRGKDPQVIEGALTVIGLDDQHAYLGSGDVQLRVGDRIAFGLRHPTSLEHWRVVPIVDDEHRIIDAVETCFS